MDLDRPQLVEIAGQFLVGVVSVVAVTGVMLLFAASYYQAVGRVDWTQWVR